MQQSQKHRAILTQQQAIEIFGFRSVKSITTMVSSASFVAKRYGINERTVRDIWKQRTWTHATSSLAEGAGPMVKRKVGRPVGSKDMRPRKQKLAGGTCTSSVLSTASRQLKCDSMLLCDASRLESEYHERNTGPNQNQQDRTAHRRQQLFSILHLESSNEAAVLGDPSLNEDERLEREEEASIDDQLHAWADRGAQWILTASLPLTADSPWACEPSAC